MNSRERVEAALRFERPDRLPVNESPWDQTAAAWYDQGIPRDMSLADYFGFDIAMMYIDASPRFPMRVLGREAGSITYEDRYGYTITKPEGVSSTMHFLEHKTKDRAAWDEIKSRFVLDPADTARIDDKMYGSRAPLLAELERKIPLARGGGYIMHSDHSCPPEVSLERYQWILDTARSIFSGG